MSSLPLPPLDVGKKLYEELHNEDQPYFENLMPHEQQRWQNTAMAAYRVLTVQPVPMLLVCPDPRCSMRHIDEGIWTEKPHHTHACQHCGTVWRPALVPTVGVQFLPGFKND